MKSQSTENNIPLVVDLDGTLINTDLLYEGILILLKKRPIYILLCFLWLIKGRLHLKKQVFKIVNIKYELLPFNIELLSFLQAEASKGRKLILATASLHSCAQEINRIFPIFNEIYGSKESNLKGKNKLNILIERFGERQFDYIGNSNADLKIFAYSRYSYLVNPTKSLDRKTRNISNIKQIWRSKNNTFYTYIKAIRVYQWMKNLLLFVPLITAHSFTSLELISNSLIGFFAFSFVASSGYVINDLLDLNSDRAHPVKQYRPFASGRLSIISGFVLAGFLLVSGLLIALQVNFEFLATLLIYFSISFSYSVYLKRIILYDVFILALLYTSRIFAGGIITNIPLSFWLIAFSTFIFLSLAFVKRYSELMKINNQTGLIERGRQYLKVDLNLLQIMGISCGFLSVVVFTLYLDSQEVTQMYTNPKILWVISFLLLFWISRIWVITNRGEMTDDPILFAAKDKGSYFVFLLIGIVFILSI